jgi:flagellar motility protein MotE (MotC chaperone)
MKSVVLFSILSFFVISTVTFLMMGVFSGMKTAWEQRNAEAPPPEETDLERQSLHARSEEISRREGELEDIEEALQLEKAVLAEEFKKLSSMQAAISGTLGDIEESKQKSLRKLAKVYEAMPAKDAAAILSGMDIELVRDVLRYMKERPAAKVMAALDPARAAVLSDMLTGHSGGGP